MVRLQRLQLDDKRRWARTKYLWNHAERLQDHGIEIVDDDPDFLVTNRGLQWEEGANTRLPRHYRNLPTIVEHAEDPVSVHSKELDILKPDNVVACYRNVIYRDPSYYFRPTANGGYFEKDYCGYMWGLSDRHDKGTLTPEPRPDLFAKIKLAIPVFGPPDEPLLREERTLTPLADREYDTLFRGDDRYTNNWPRRHRHALREAMQPLPGNNLWAADRLQRAAYVRELSQTKIALSPWGYGPWNIRDLEALLCGCVLLKPYTGFIVTDPDIYDPANGCVVYCNPDWSDLPEKVRRVLANLPKAQERVDRARQLVEDRLWPVSQVVDRWVNMLAADVHTALDNSPT